jgi:hypothetical protein
MNTQSNLTEAADAMDTAAKRIRKAALGWSPDYPEHLASWVGSGYEWGMAKGFVSHPAPFLKRMSQDERRMFLLFVAEALRQINKDPQ